MSIDLISDTIERISVVLPRPFTTHNVVEELILNHRDEWNNFVNGYEQNERNIATQEQIAVQQVGRYLGRNANNLGFAQRAQIPSNIIRGLSGHKPQRTTQWI